MNRGARNDSEEPWEVVRQRVQDRMSKPMYDTFIASTVGEIAEGNTFIIKAATDFAAEWITERYKDHFIAVLGELTGQDFNVQVTCGATRVERSEGDCLLIGKGVMNANGDSNIVKVKRASVGIPIITPSNSTIKLRRDNEKIMRSLNLPLADLGISHTEKRIYAENERIRKKRKKPRKWWCNH